MGAFGLDALSSVAYGPDEILYVLILAGTAGVALDMPIAIAIAALLGIVAFSTARRSTPTRTAAARTPSPRRTWARAPASSRRGR